MAEHIDLGKQGEQSAVNYLIRKGYKIIEQNWRFGKNEIDIIARDGKCIVVVEVKTRNSNYFAEPETNVTHEKQRILVRAANAYVRNKHLNDEVRFDVIAILAGQDEVQINHIVDAFYPTLR
jgi:putative endonuclease